MVVIRLSKGGAVHRPFYHVVVTDSRAPRDSRYIERIGFLNYFATGAEKKVELDEERLKFWVDRGAVLRPSITKIVKLQKREALNAENKDKKGEKSAAKENKAEVKTEAKAQVKPQEQQEAKPPEAKTEAKSEATDNAEKPEEEAKPAPDTPAEKPA